MGDKWFYQYYLKWYVEWDDQCKEEEGIIYAESFSDAMAQLENMYGDKAIEEIFYLAPLEEWLDRDVIEKIKWRAPAKTEEDCDACKLQVSRSVKKFSENLCLKIFEFLKYKFTYSM